MVMKNHKDESYKEDETPGWSRAMLQDPRLVIKEPHPLEGDK